MHAAAIYKRSREKSRMKLFRVGINKKNCKECRHKDLNQIHLEEWQRNIFRKENIIAVPNLRDWGFDYWRSRLNMILFVFERGACKPHKCTHSKRIKTRIYCEINGNRNVGPRVTVRSETISLSAHSTEKTARPQIRTGWGLMYFSAIFPQYNAEPFPSGRSLQEAADRSTYQPESFDCPNSSYAERAPCLFAKTKNNIKFTLFLPPF